MKQFIMLFLLLIGGTCISCAQMIAGAQITCSNDLSNYLFVHTVPYPCDTAHNCSFVWEVWNGNQVSVGNGMPLFTQSQSLSNSNPNPWSVWINWNTMYLSSNSNGNPRPFTISMRKTGCVPNNCSTPNPQFLAIYPVEVHRNPFRPSPISGNGVNANEVIVLCGSTSPITLSVPTVLGAVSYSWTYPASWSVSGISTNNTITLIPNTTTGQGANICVYALGSGSCDDGNNISQSRCVTINRGVPVAGLPITPTNMLLCANANQTIYTTVCTAPGASYTWQITTGGLRFNTNNGTTITTSVPNVVVKAPLTGSGTSYVSVKVNTLCGNSQYSPSTIITYGLPVMPSTINVTLCQMPSVAICPTGAGIPTTLNWSVNPGVIDDTYGNTCEFIVDFVNYPQNYYIDIGASRTNICGTGPTKWVSRACNCCGDGASGILWRTANNTNEENTMLYPNPIGDILYVNIKPSEGIFQQIRIYNLEGKFVLNSSEKEVNTSNLSKGMYIYQIITDKVVLNGKITK